MTCSQGPRKSPRSGGSSIRRVRWRRNCPAARTLCAMRAKGNRRRGKACLARVVKTRGSLTSGAQLDMRSILLDRNGEFSLDPTACQLGEEGFPQFTLVQHLVEVDI